MPRHRTRGGGEGVLPVSDRDLMKSVVYQSYLNVPRMVQLMMTAVKLLNSSLDMLMGKSHLNAVIPTEFSGGNGKLNWIPMRTERGLRSYPIESNEDLEEQFHWMFGPYVLDDYVGELEFMLHDVVSNDAGKCSFVCSTVRIEVSRIQGLILQIQQIFIRPCLQRHGVLGKILSYLAEHVTDQQISVEHCLPESSAAMIKYYGGGDSSLFTQDVGQGNGLITFTMINPKAFQEMFAKLEKRAYPLYEALNGRALSTLEWTWGQFARFVQEEELDDSLVSHQFEVGYGDEDMHYFRNLCMSMYEELMSLKEIYLEKLPMGYLNRTAQEIEADEDEQNGYFAWRYKLCHNAMVFVEHLRKADVLPHAEFFR
jgi:hypothetical protein